MTAIVGISAFYHDSAVALIVDGQIVAAAQEERFTRRKHDAAFPSNALNYCLESAGMTPAQIDYVAFYEKPLRKFDRLLETYLAYAPRGFSSFKTAIPVWLKQKLFHERELRRHLPGYTKRFVFPEHHESHAASAFYPSPFDEAAIITVDGVGEWSTTTIGRGRGSKIELLSEQKFPHSLGMLYSACTLFCGFKVNSGEYKLMGLAPYGRPIYADLIREKLIEQRPDGSYRLQMPYFNYCEGLTMTSRKFEQLFGGKPRPPETLLTQREMDLAASIQVVTEEILLNMSRYAYDQSGGLKQLCLAGGVALNCVANGRILREGPFEKVWIQPAAGDAGGALGAALFTWHQLLGQPREVHQPDSQRGSLLGPSFSNDQIRALLDRTQARYEYIPNDEELCRRVALHLADEQVVGWFQGRAEFGPRALGCRSTLGDRRSQLMQSIMNLKIKFRESFRPFAPSVLRERVAEYFEMRPNEDSPYMLLVAPVHPARLKSLSDEERQRTGIEQLYNIRSEIPAVTHVDNSARIQTVDEQRHGRYYQLIKQFEQLTGCPVLINTSFNVRGEPIVGTPEQAYRCFLATNIDLLVLENCILRKSEQPQIAPDEVDRYLSQFSLD